ncbi:uncharacterized protein Hap1MRO34_023451 isoform 1-T2 [Clarias gariepinus]
MKSDYRSIKDHNSRSGSNRRSWKWFDKMDAIYGGRPTSNGREGALDSATQLLLENTIEDDSLSTIDSLALSPCNDDSSSQAVLAASPPRPPTPSASSCTTTPQRVLTGKRKRSLHHQKHLAVLREMQVADIEQQELNRAQRERHLQMALEEAKQARKQEAALRAEKHSQTAAFNQAFLNVMGMLVQENEWPTGIELSC